MKKYIAEFTGTFCLALIVCLAVTSGVQLPIATPVLAALTVGLFVYTVGSISGTHLNPAVTLGVLSIKKISLRDAAIYIIVQLLGAVTASMLVVYFFPAAALHGIDSLKMTYPSICFGEFIGTAILGFGIASVIFERTPAAAAGLVIGGSLLLGINAAIPFSEAILNPAVAFAVGKESLKAVLCQCLGAIAGFNLYKAIK